MKTVSHDSSSHSGYDNTMIHDLFNPHDYIEPLENGYALCSNPMVGGGLNAITVNTNLAGEALHNFEGSVKRMVVAKLFSAKFAEVILAATRLGHSKNLAV